MITVTLCLSSNTCSCVINIQTCGPNHTCLFEPLGVVTIFKKENNWPLQYENYKVELSLCRGSYSYDFF